MRRNLFGRKAVARTAKYGSIGAASCQRGGWAGLLRPGLSRFKFKSNTCFAKFQQFNLGTRQLRRRLRYEARCAIRYDALRHIIVVTLSAVAEDGRLRRALPSPLAKARRAILGFYPPRFYPRRSCRRARPAALIPWRLLLIPRFSARWTLPQCNQHSHQLSNTLTRAGQKLQQQRLRAGEEWITSMCNPRMIHMACMPSMPAKDSVLSRQTFLSKRDRQLRSTMNGSHHQSNRRC
eukprot:6192850-Pleurochrysis_carterae.AAC.1